MPFSTDNSWPAGLLKIFEICREVNRPLENRYYGPYDKLINYCFGDSFTFFVAPQHPLDNATKEVKTISALAETPLEEIASSSKCLVLDSWSRPQPFTVFQYEILKGIESHHKSSSSNSSVKSINSPTSSSLAPSVNKSTA